MAGAAASTTSTGTPVDQADNEWAIVNFEMARDNPELLALMLRQYADEFDMGWTDEQIEVMVAQLMTAGAVLMTAKDDAYKDFDDEWIDPAVEARFREMARTALGTTEIWWGSEPLSDEQWADIEAGADIVDVLTPKQIRELLREYAQWLATQEMSTVDLLLEDFKNLVFDYSAFFGDDASAPGAAIEILAILPVGDLAKLLKHADEAAEAAQQASRAAEAAADAARAVDPDDVEEIVEEAAEIGENAADRLDEAGDVVGAGDNADDAATAGGRSADDPPNTGGEVADEASGEAATRGTFDSESSTQLRPAEVNTAELLVELPEMQGRVVRAHPDDRYDFIDDLGRPYDAMGTPSAYQYWNENGFFTAILSHTRKSGSTTVIDLTGASSDQILSIKEYVASLPAATQDTIIYVGGH